MAASVKITDFWDVASCSFVEHERCFECAYSLHYQGDEGGSKHPRKVCKLIPDYMVQQPRR
jgi:hypothetical protein